MEAYFDGLRVFQSPDNDIMVIRDERPVMHIACTKQLKKRELIQTVRELREIPEWIHYHADHAQPRSQWH